MIVWAWSEAGEIRFECMMDIMRLKRMEHVTLFMLDVISYGVVFVAVQWLRHSQVDIVASDVPFIGFPLIVLLGINYVFGLYSLEENGSYFDSVQSSFLAVGAAITGFLLIVLCVYAWGVEHFVGQYFGRGVLVGTVGGFALVAAIYRFYLRRVFIKINNRHCYLVVTNKEQFVGMERENQKSLLKKRLEFCSLERFENMYEKSINSFNDYVGIVISSFILEELHLANKLMELRLKGIGILTVHDFFEKIWLKVPLFDLKDRWFVAERGFGLIHHPINRKLKRFSDIIFAIFLICLTLVLFPFIAILIKLTSRGPVLFFQERMGENGKPFIIYKFRSMEHEVEGGGIRQVTFVGRFLRRMRLDELPQFWNVLRGDMSLVGPRPEFIKSYQQFEAKNPYYKFRYLVKPGITGWAQVLYPHGATFEDAMQKLQYELYYIKNYSFLLDLSIVIKTVRVVLSGRGK